MARQVIPIIGAGVGFLFGGPTGAQIGWAVGAAVGNAVDPQVLPGPRIGEISQQTSQEGGARPIVFALSPPIAGNIIATSEPNIVRSTQSQGKGGPKVETETVYRTYAVGVCEGPITGFWRVWRNGILVYDVSDNSILTTAENDKFLETARLFSGTYSQDPSPDLEAVFGIGTTPAHRGTAYLVQSDEDLTDLRGAIPQYVFQVVRCEGFFGLARLTDHEIHRTREGAACTSGFRFNANGNLEFALNDGTWSTAGAPSDEWLYFGLQEHFVRISVDSGTLTTGTEGSWLSTSTSPAATIVQPTVGVKNTVCTVQLARDPDGLDIVAEAEFDLEAEVTSADSLQLAAVGNWFFPTNDGNGADIDLPAHDVGDLLVGLLVEAFDGTPSSLDGGTRWQVLHQNQVSNWEIQLLARIADGTADDNLFFNGGSASRPRAGQMAVFTGNPHTNLSTIKASDDEIGEQTDTTFPYPVTPSSGFANTLVIVASGKEITASSLGNFVSAEAGLSLIGQTAQIVTAGDGLQVAWGYAFQATASQINAGAWDNNGTNENKTSFAISVRLKSGDS